MYLEKFYDDDLTPEQRAAAENAKKAELDRVLAKIKLEKRTVVTYDPYRDEIEYIEDLDSLEEP